MKYEIQDIPVGKIKRNPKNPRVITDVNFSKLVQSIKDFPEMLSIRPIILNKKMIPLGGNMRWQAAKAAGLKTVPCIVVSHFTPQQEKEFTIKDNVSGGEWDFDALRENWDLELLDAWGLDMPKFDALPEDEDDKPAPEPSNAWFLNIEFASESDCQLLFEELTARGLAVKIVQ